MLRGNRDFWHLCSCTSILEINLLIFYLARGNENALASGFVWALIVFILLHLQRRIQRSIQALICANEIVEMVQTWESVWLDVWISYTCPGHTLYGSWTELLTTGEKKIGWCSSGKLDKLHAQSWCLLLLSCDQISMDFVLKLLQLYW